MKAEVAIVGAGLAGLALADSLHRAGVAFRLFEARPRPGGRIAALETPLGRVDLGPSWFWPGQPRMAHLVADLGLEAFMQHATGDACFEDELGQVHRGQGFASMAGAFRLAGGMARLAEGLTARLPAERLHLACPVVEIARDGAVLLADGRSCQAPVIVLALPPRIAAGLRFDPHLPPEVMRSLEAIPTWMAGHAKVVAVYARPFWRDAGLSGDAVSRRGPLAEIHDASGPGGVPAALFGFVGVPAPARAGRARDIEAAALDQFGRIFGAEAMTPMILVIRDWAFEPETAIGRDHDPPVGHPAYGLLPGLDDIWEGRLHFASTEIATEMGGLMEGALAAAARVSGRILGARTQRREPA
jgi:monoamine oxidase